MDILDLGSEAAPSDASPWAATLEMIFATVQGPVPPAPMQLQVAHQARALVEEIVLAPLPEASPEAAWVAITYPSSVVLISGERSLVAQLQFGSVVTVDMSIPDQAAWSIVWDSPGADAESLLSGVLSGSAAASSARPAVRIGVFQGDRRAAETAFDQAGGWQDELDDRALIEDVNRRLEEAGRSFDEPGEGIGAAAGTPPAPGSVSGAGAGVAGVSGGVLAGAAAAVAGVAAAAIAREVAKKRAQTEPASSAAPTPPSPPHPPVSSLPVRWYYMQEARQEGPIEEPAIRQLAVQGIITADTLVWNESLPDWTTAARAGLVVAPQTGFPKPPPPPPPAAAPPGNPSLTTRPCPKCRAQVGARARFCTSCGHPIG